MPADGAQAAGARDPGTLAEVGAGRPPLRLRRIDPASSGWEGALDAAAAAGFGHVLLPSVFAATRLDRTLVSDHARVAPALGGGEASAWLSSAVRAAEARGLGLVLDVRPDRVAAGSALAGQQAALFAAPDPDAVLDPRREVDVAAAPARTAVSGWEEALGAWWGHRLGGWASLGVAGFRVHGLDRLPGGALPGLLGGLRAGAPGSLLLLWTPGIAAEAVDGLSGLGLDGVFCSLPWWDGRAGWLWSEVARLRRVAPVLASVAVPGGSAGILPPALAAAVADGWLDCGGTDEDPSALNRALAGGTVPAGGLALPLGGAGPVLALLRTDAADARFATRSAVMLLNLDPERAHAVDPALLLPALGGLRGLEAVLPEGAAPFDTDALLVLPPGGMRLEAARDVMESPPDRPLDASEAREAGDWARVAIENPSPVVDDGTLPVKRTVGEGVTVEVDVVCDGHDKLAVALQWRGPPDDEPREARMRPLGNDRYAASFPLPALGRYRYRVQAWRDAFESFRDELGKKHAAAVPIELEMIEGTRLVERVMAGTEGALRERIGAALAEMEAGPEARLRTLLSPTLAADMAEADPRHGAVVLERPVTVQAERLGARFASWYEVFPRSMSDDPARHGTFADVERHLPRVRAMGFDVLYFPPIHPIGTANRKGRNNTLTPGPDDVGSPYAIGSEEGGHDAIHPRLGTVEDFRHLVAAARDQGIELALDFAVQCSPDHPWLKEHRGWFDWRPDGSIKYAENPPKKYQDIVNVDFYAEDAVPGLWLALCEAVLFWARLGVRLFRVDNPHTKPLPFWQWMIAAVQERFPDAVFLAEAFTRPKVMYRLAKVGFSQSYTYFTWRNTKAEMAEYLTELADTAPREFFRPHFFVNTPDINPVFLQGSGRPGFLIRAALAATLSGLWGVYSGFELCEAAALPGREEYLDSEKYEIRAWDWDRPGNIVPEVTRLNAIRADNPALQTHLGVTFHPARNDQVLFFEKATADRSNVVLVAISMDPAAAQEADVEAPLYRWALPDDGALALEELAFGGEVTWRGKYQRVRLTPERPYAVWRARPA